MVVLHEPAEVSQRHFARVGRVPPLLLLVEDTPEEADRRRLVGTLTGPLDTLPLWVYWTYQIRPRLNTEPSP
jgi:hypothetical protein